MGQIKLADIMMSNDVAKITRRKWGNLRDYIIEHIYYNIIIFWRAVLPFCRPLFIYHWNDEMWRTTKY